MFIMHCCTREFPFKSSVQSLKTIDKKKCMKTMEDNRKYPERQYFVAYRFGRVIVLLGSTFWKLLCYWDLCCECKNVYHIGEGSFQIIRSPLQGQASVEYKIPLNPTSFTLWLIRLTLHLKMFYSYCKLVTLPGFLSYSRSELQS